MKEHKFGAASFKIELWIDNKRVFEKPKRIDVEFITAGAFDWVIADEKGTEIRQVRHENLNGGWTSLDLNSLGLFNNYSIGFRNASASEQKLKQGIIYF